MSTSLKKLKQEQEQTAILRDVGEAIQRITAIHRARTETQSESVKEFRQTLIGFAGEDLPFEVMYPEVSKERQKPLLLAVGPERGLVGDLHREIAHAVSRRLEWHSYKRIFVAGNRLCGFLASTTDTLFTPYPALSERPGRDELLGHAHAILEGRRKGQWNVVELLYPKYDSITSYHIEEKTLLPLEVKRKSGQATSSTASLYFIEPNIDAVIRRLEEMLFVAELYEIFLEARYVELSQRLLASTRATESAKRILKVLRRQYLREVRGRTTKTINEIFTGRKAYEVKSKKNRVALEWVI